MSKKSNNNLVTLGSAAVLAVYAAGYLRTKSAALLFADESAGRRPRATTMGITAPSAPVVTAVSKPSSPPMTRSTARPSAAGAATKPAIAAAIRTAPAVPKAKPADSVPPMHGAPATPPLAAALPTAGQANSTPNASPPAEAPQPAEQDRGPYRDGTYSGWGSSRHGDIQASVEIRDGRIYAATITQCLTRYSCSWISALPGQVVARQSPETDYVSGATQSTNAFYYAVVEALKQAK